MDDAIAKTVQQLRALRQDIDRQIGECLARLDASERKTSAEETVGTPSVEVPRKRRRRGVGRRRLDVTSSEEDGSDAPEEVALPYRGDMSHWAQLFLQVYRQHRDEVESRAGKRQRVAYVYGNYPRYYSYRLSDPTFDEPRLQVLEKEWFCEKDVLDVGCHIGIVPLGIVLHFSPGSMTGVEIDASLHGQAQQMRSELIRTYKRNGKRETVRRLKKTRFVQGDFMELSHHLHGGCDVLTCLSVSKWIHFHHGDEGMRHLFHQFWKVLRETGLLIFEPQPIRSYRKAVQKQDLSTVPFTLSDIQFHPDAFVPYLTEDVGFELVKTVMLDERVGGFDRPLHVLRKRPGLTEEST